MAIEALPPARLGEIRPLLLDLLVEEQEPVRGRRASRAHLDGWLPPTAAQFQGRNRVFVSRAPDGSLEGFCWCVLFDPGTGLEGELAELYVVPEARGRGVGRLLAEQASRLFAAERVTFACVWTEASNRAAVSAYRRAGFEPTGHLVMTWHPEA